MSIRGFEMAAKYSSTLISMDIEIRRDIYSYIQDNPGLHLRALQRALDISLGNLRYHLDYLEKNELIVTNFDGYRKTYFPPQERFGWDRGVLALLRQRMPREIIICLIERSEYMSFNEIQTKMNISKSSLSFQLKKLTENKIVQFGRADGKNYYFISEKDKERVINLLIQYQSSFIDEAIDRVVDVWLR